jgi:ABC-type phosphate transport system auxiliary subunit
MRIRRYAPVMLGEHWIYLTAAVISIVVVALLHIVKAPVSFGIW